MGFPENKDAAKRLKRKLRLQELRCNLMSTKMTELKTALSSKKRQLRITEKRAKDEEKKRRDEEKKLKDMEKEFHRLRKENDQIKENLTRNQNGKSTSTTATATTPTLTQQQQQPQASTSNSSCSLQSLTFTPLPANTSSVPNSNKKKNKHNKRMAASIADDSHVQAQASKSLVNRMAVPMVIGSSSGNSKKTETVASSTPSSSKDLRINEGASCSGINTSLISTTCTEIIADTSKNSNNVIHPNGDDHHFLGTSKLEDLFENELMCPICHELYIKPVALSCSHIFCSFCIEQWRRKAHRCPICRNMILDRSPQNVLENVIDKVVSTMDEDSKQRRADVIKDRPTPPEHSRFSRNDGRRDRLLATLQGGWRDLADYARQSTDSFSDSDSYMPSFSSPLPAYGAFTDRSDSSDIGSYPSDIDPEEFFGPLFEAYEYNDREYYDDQNSPTEEDDDDSDDDDDDDDNDDDTESDEYLSDDSVLYDFNVDEHGANYDFDHNSSLDSWAVDQSWQSSGQNSPITIDSDSDSSSIYVRHLHSNDNSVYSERHDNDQEGDEEEEDQGDEEDDDEGDEEEDVENEDDDDEVDEEGDDEENEDDEEDEEDDEDDDNVDGEDYFDGDEDSVIGSDFDESGNSSPWESMEMTESDSDL